MGLRNQIGTISPAGAHARLLHARKNGERRATHERADVEKLPTRGKAAREGPQKSDAIEWQDLNPTHSEDVGDIESGWTFFGARIPGILRQRLQHYAGGSKEPAEHGAGVIERF